jgi:hypothetical protein
LKAIHSSYLLFDQGYSQPEGAGKADPVLRSPYLKLVNLSPEVAKVVRTAGFDQYMEIESDLQTVLSALETGKSA